MSHTSGGYRTELPRSDQGKYTSSTAVLEATPASYLLVTTPIAAFSSRCFYGRAHAGTERLVTLHLAGLAVRNVCLDFFELVAHVAIRDLLIMGGEEFPGRYVETVEA